MNACNWYTVCTKLRFRLAGIRYGKRLKVMGPVILRLNGPAKNISFGDDVTIMPWADLKIRGNGKIIVHNRVLIDTMARLVAANEARIEIGDDVCVGMGTIVNAGADVIIGKNSAIGGYCCLVASDHEYKKGIPIMKQGYRHSPIILGEDVWLASDVFIKRGVKVGDGAVIGAKTLVASDVPANAVFYGNPGQTVKTRE